MIRRIWNEKRGRWRRDWREYRQEPLHAQVGWAFAYMAGAVFGLLYVAVVALVVVSIGLGVADGVGLVHVSWLHDSPKKTAKNHSSTAGGPSDSRSDASEGSRFCQTHRCIASFDNGTGYKIQCADGMWSHSGGVQGACSHHGGVKSAGQHEPSKPAGPESESPGLDHSDTTKARTVKTCFPGYSTPTVRIPAVHIPAQRISGFTLNGHKYPAQKLPAVDLPAQTIPGETVPRHCETAPASFSLHSTTIRTSGYESIDPLYSDEASEEYWNEAPDVATPDPTAAGFGEFNAAGFPKNQYVRPYVRKDGTHVDGYWRNSPSDGLPTCRVIGC